MKVLMICERFPPDLGGLATSGGRLASTLAGLGCDVQVLAWSRQLPPGCVESTPVNGLVLHRMGRFSNWDLTMQHSLNFINWLHQQHQFEATWGHYLQVAGFLSVMFARQAKIKSIVSARGNDVDQLMFPPGDFARLKWTLEEATLVTSVSAELSRKIHLIVGDDVRVEVIPNAVGMDIFSPGEPDPALRDRLGIHGDEIVLGFSGELRHKKGLSFLPCALAEVRESRPACILVIGEIRAREQSTLSGFAAEDPETAERFLSTGHLEDPVEVAAHLRICDLILQPSVWDGMPNSVLEAMACERLVLASDAGGIPEVLEHGVNGVMIPKTRLNHLGQAITETLDLPQERKDAMRVAARRTVEERFTAKNERQSLGRLIQALG